MNWVNILTFCVLFSITAGDDQLRPGLLQEFYNVFNNLSNLASMPNLMETPDCRRDCEIYRQALHQNQMWAAEMYDANGRLSLGILKGNIHQIGHMEQCVSSSSKTSNIEGKFCVVKIYLKPLPSNEFMNDVWKNVFNSTMITSKPYKRTPIPSPDIMFSTLCVPSSCTAKDLMIAARRVLSILNHTTLGFEVHVDDLTERNCAVYREYYATNPVVNFAKVFIFSMIILVICATIFDVFFFQKTQNDPNLLRIISTSFSLKQNYRTMMNVENDTDSIGFLNGFRCFTYLILFSCHYCPKIIICVVDGTDGFAQFLQNPFLRTIWKNPWIVLDSLFFSSGISHSHKIVKFLMRNDTKSILKSMLYKYLRFLMFWVFFFSIQSTSTGKTMINLLYTPPENKNSIWSILLCFENFNGIENMHFGLLHTFYTDIQLYFICCIVLILTRRCENKIKPIFLIAFGSLVCRSLFFYFCTDVQAFLTTGMSIYQVFDMVTYMYATPFSILPFYMSGVALGYYLRENPNNKITLSNLNQKLGWMIALLCLSIALLPYYQKNSQYKYNSFDGAMFSFIDSFCWIIFFIWIALYCEIIENNSGDNRFLSTNIFVILNRLTPYFTALHIFIICQSSNNTRFLLEFKLSEIIGLDYLFLSILACAFVMLFLHLPLRNTWKIITTNKSSINKIDGVAAINKYE